MPRTESLARGKPVGDAFMFVLFQHFQQPFMGVTIIHLVL